MEKTGELYPRFVEVVAVVGVVGIKDFFLLPVIDENFPDLGILFDLLLRWFPQFIMLRLWRFIVNVFDEG